MLNPSGLEQQIKNALDQYLPVTFEQAAHVLIPAKTEDSDDLCKEFGQTLAAAIDYYVKNISISGTILTTGSPVAQQAMIAPAPTPVVAGVIPNTLKVQ